MRLFVGLIFVFGLMAVLCVDVGWFYLA